MSQIIVIGGGAAGMMAAYTAAANGHNVRLLEKNEKLGKKIYITGKGRCNFTNACDFPVFIENIVSNPRFMYSSCRAFGPQDMIRLLEDAGCPVKIERGSRAFPLSDHASDVTKALERCMKSVGVRVELNTEVTGIRPYHEDRPDTDSMFLPLTEEGTPRFFVKARQRGKDLGLHADAVIVCTGGLSYASTGSSGDGYRFAEEAGLKLRPCSPALVPLTASEEDCAALQGVSLKNVSVRVSEAVSGKTVLEDGPGELLFTHFGLSGPLVLTASSLISEGLSRGKEYLFAIDLKPALSSEKLDERILRDFQDRKNMRVENALSGLLISALRPVLLHRAGIDPDSRVNELSRKERMALVRVIKNFSFTINGTRGYAEAVITQGGVCTSEIDPRTMESKRCPGLYFAGEVLDVDAFTGGFNLQIAWSTGHAAGTGCK